MRPSNIPYGCTPESDPLLYEMEKSRDIAEWIEEDTAFDDPCMHCGLEGHCDANETGICRKTGEIV